MKCYKAAILNQGGESSIDHVYSADQLKELAEITELMPGVQSLENVEKGDLKEAEVLFSTWGMPTLEDRHFELMPNVKAVFYSAGATDAFAPNCFAHGVRVFSAWRANAIPVAEFCMAQILLALKGYFRCVRELKGPEQFNFRYAGQGVYGETVALIGAGAISRKLQEMLKAFNLNVIVIPSRKENRTVSLEEAFSKAIVVSNHLPNRDDNVGVLNEPLFRSMREGAVFINTGRGRQVNEEDLIRVMEDRPDLTALLDVTFPEPPPAGSKLYTTPNILVSPHIAGSLNDEVRRMSDYMLAEYKRFATGEEAVHEVLPGTLLTS
jgi:phosphoglycerate dehydrogenase-like enzyme